MQTELSIVHTLVFGATATGGNPCPVVLNANSLTDEQMRSLAVRFNSETVFVLPATTPEATIRLRYFVPEYEMEMCVHATVGTLTVLHQMVSFQQNQLHLPFVIETPLGIVQASWQQQESLEILLDQFAPTFSDHNPTKAEVASALQIPEAAIIDTHSPIQSVSTSRPKLMIPICDWQTLDAIQPDFEKLWQLCDTFQTTGFYPFTIRTRSDFDVEARQFPRRAGYNEDPATGVAACALAAYLTCYQPQPFTVQSSTVRPFTIGQGYAMGKPSRIFAQTHMQNGEISRVQVGGSAIITASETLCVNGRMNKLAQ